MHKTGNQGLGEWWKAGAAKSGEGQSCSITKYCESSQGVTSNSGKVFSSVRSAFFRHGSLMGTTATSAAQSPVPTVLKRLTAREAALVLLLG